MNILDAISHLLRINAILRKLYNYLFRLYSDSEPKFYPNRTQSDELFIKLLTNSKNVNFVGISHSSLSGYLKDAINLGKGFRWEKLNVFFARLEDGILWEGNNYHDQILSSIKSISSVLTSFVHLESVRADFTINYFLMSHHSTFGGSSLDYNCFFVTHYLPGENSDTKKEYTIFIDKKNPKPEVAQLTDWYEEAYRRIRNRSSLICRYIPHMWDISVEEWDSFVSECDAYQKNMDLTIDKCDVRDGDRILEVGCGTGLLAQKLIESGKRIQLTIVDRSPQMIKFCEKNLDSRIKKIPLDITDSRSDTLFFLGAYGGFDKIISHLTFPIPEESQEKFELLLKIISNLLHPSGKFVLSILNTSVHIESDTYNVNGDFFREGIYEQLDVLGLSHVSKHLHRKVFTNQEIEELAKQYNMIKTDEVNSSYSFSMKERISMWKVPAVLNTILEYNQLPDEKRIKLFSNIEAFYSHRKTKNLATKTFVFEKVVEE